MNFIITLVAIGIGSGLYFFTKDVVSDNTTFVIKTVIQFIIQAGFVFASVYYAKKYAKARALLEKHGISEEEKLT